MALVVAKVCNRVHRQVYVKTVILWSRTSQPIDDKTSNDPVVPARMVRPKAMHVDGVDASSTADDLHASTKTLVACSNVARSRVEVLYAAP